MNRFVSRSFNVNATQPLRQRALTLTHRHFCNPSPAANVTTAVANANGKVGLWLLGCSGLVFGIVVVGGLTRLTRSGLSMTDWKFHGGFPPMNQKEWEDEFEKYKTFPEWKRINQEMSVNEFKTIYKWEYWHRMFGRAIGVAFTVPFVYFAARRQLSPWLLKRLGGLFALGAAQGGIGWWMVKSGLEESNQTWNNLPRVSPYRMATHLAMAFTLYVGLLWTGFCTYAQRPKVLEALKVIGAKAAQPPTQFRMLAHTSAGFTLLTALMGAFVAGNEAGWIYNEWPKMGLGYIPSDLINEYIHPSWRNWFENSTAVQFAHRNLAYGTVIASTALWIYSRRVPQLSAQALLGAHLMCSVAWAQTGLGVWCLTQHCPVNLASMHQGGAMTTLAVAIWLIFLMRRGGYGATTRLMQDLMRHGKPKFLIV